MTESVFATEIFLKTKWHRNQFALGHGPRGAQGKYDVRSKDKISSAL